MPGLQSCLQLIAIMFELFMQAFLCAIDEENVKMEEELQIIDRDNAKLDFKRMFGIGETTMLTGNPFMAIRLKMSLI
jgi:hypothetical protein